MKTDTGTQEIRMFPVSELRADSDNGEITGHAAVFDQEADIWGDKEVIRRGAFKKTISDGADIFAFWNHDSNGVLGRTKNDTLSLAEDKKGLKVSILPPDTPTAQEVRTLIRDGFIDKMSFGFRVIVDKWTHPKEGNGPSLREILEVQLFEVSPVPFPAYDGTDVTARGMRPVKPPCENINEKEHKQEQSENSDGPTEPSRDQRSHSLSEVEKSKRRLALIL
ncbi:hypothetical protein LCGC14_0972270 [marine sediment metagenome]|uniref:Prohead serine protease domain-containing protein n=1 Tax=marine sediment metagenome TaxID=412755 RepID=A0A0F9NXK5_9ZZZZ